MTKVFVHGNPESDAIWGPLTAALAERGVDDVVRLSPPGFGAPTPEGWEPTPASYVRWLAGELERLPGEIDLVGHDWGAGHTFGLAAARPELLRSWAADCAGLLHPDYQWHDAARTWQQEGAGEEWIEEMVALPLQARVDAYTGLGIPSDIAAPMAAAFDEEMGRCILGLYRAAAQPALVELGDRLAAADPRPGLALDPTEDPYVPSTLAGPVADRLGAQRLTLHGQGHWWMLEDPGAAADGLVSFWRGL